MDLGEQKCIYWAIKMMCASKKGFIFIPLLIVVVLAVGGIGVYRYIETSKKTVGELSRIKIFLIALEDQGRVGKLVGCGDSLISLDKGEKFTSEPIKNALEELFSIKEQFYGQSGLYNALAQSNLKVENVSLINNKAIVRLSGTYSLAGSCDNPRFEGQIRETILQYVKETEIFLNNKSLGEILSGKGG